MKRHEKIRNDTIRYEGYARLKSNWVPMKKKTERKNEKEKRIFKQQTKAFLKKKEREKRKRKK